MAAFGNKHLLELAVNDLDIITNQLSPDEIIAMVESETGRRYTPSRNQVFVRTDPMVKISPGGILLTGQESNFYRGPAHEKIIKSTVITVGPLSSIKPRERVCFQRLYFAKIQELKDGTLFGSVDENELVGYIVEE